MACSQNDFQGTVDMTEVFTIIIDRGARLIYLNSSLESLCSSMGKSALYKTADALFENDSVKSILLWWKGSIHNKKYLDLKLIEELDLQINEPLEWFISPLVSQKGEEGFAILTASCEREIETADTTHISHLLEITELMNASLEDGAVLEKLSSFIHQTLNYDHVAVYLLVNDELRLKANHGAQVLEPYHNVPVKSGVVGRAVYKCEAIVISDVSKCSFYNPSISGTRSEVAVPIKTPALYEGKATENVIGILNVESTRVNAFSQADVIKFKAVANTLAIAIENGRLMDRVLGLLRAESIHSQEVIHKKAELDEFIHTISHDLRNPLNNIAGFVELLNDDIQQPRGSDIAKYINRIKANINNVSRLIDDLLELSRVGRMDQEFVAVPMADLVKDIHYDLKASGEYEDFDVKFGTLPETIKGNRHRITQLIINLVSNAYKYRHPDRQAKVVISCSESPKEYCFAVRDNGIGISEKHAGSIFVFGFRIKEKAVDGSGAGLAISKKIVEAHGGKMWVDSIPGQGSTFYFTIPK